MAKQYPDRNACPHVTGAGQAIPHPHVCPCVPRLSRPDLLDNGDWRGQFAGSMDVQAAALSLAQRFSVPITLNRNDHNNHGFGGWRSQCVGYDT